MNRMTLFSSPFLLGFDRLERVLDRASKSAGDGYPPYNVEQTGDTSWEIVIAVAGFTAADLEVSLEDDLLIISGAGQEEPDRVYMHRGIASRQFQRRFVLADGMKIDEARLAEGLLHIHLVRPAKKPRVERIPITQSS